jgi:hypothetical protein
MSRKPPIDNLGYAALLSLDSGLSTGSGFQLLYETKKVLVTAKHVLYNEDEKLRCKSLVVSFQSPKGKEGDAEIIELDMEHSKILFSKKEDLAMILLANKDSYSDKFIYEDYVKVYEEGNVTNSAVDSTATRLLDEIGIGNDVFLIGYPTSLFFQNIKYFDITKPLLRKGVIAGLHLRENTFIIDCPAYYGNSGAPIIEVCEDEVFRVIGLVSKYVPFVVEWRNSREAVTNTEYLNSGYSVCVPMNSIHTLIKQGFS